MKNYWLRKERKKLKNKEIIARAAVELGMYTEEEVKRMLDQEEEIPLHTLHGWNRFGEYQVKDGEEGVEVRLWKKKEDGTGFYLAKAFLYRLDQLEEQQ